MQKLLAAFIAAPYEPALSRAAVRLVRHADKFPMSVCMLNPEEMAYLTRAREIVAAMASTD